MDTSTPTPAETADETYIEAGPHVIAGGRWHIQRDGNVFYEREDGRFERAQVGAYTLRNDRAFTLVTTPVDTPTPDV